MDTPARRVALGAAVRDRPRSAVAAARKGCAARDLLAPIYARFTEGFARADLEAANALLQGSGSLRSP
jgi:predicted ATPase